MAAIVSFPRKDSDLFQWSLNFSTKISAGPVLYGLSAPQAVAYATVHSNFGTALAAVEPTIRSMPATATKNEARAALKNSAKLLAMIVQGTPTVTTAQKLSLGLSIQAQPTPQPVPPFAPAVDITRVVGRTVNGRLHDSQNPSKRGKPTHCKGAAIFSFVGPVAPSDPDLYKFEGNTTVTDFEVVFPSTVVPGTVVYITAIWFNERAQSGPACEPVPVTIGYGMSQAA